MIEALWSYLAASDVWTKNASPVKKWKSSGMEFVQLWIDLYRRLTKEKLEETMVIMKRIWAGINKFIFENKFTSPGKIVKNVVAKLVDFHKANIAKYERQN